MFLMPVVTNHMNSYRELHLKYHKCISYNHNHSTFHQLKISFFPNTKYYFTGNVLDFFQFELQFILVGNPAYVD